MKKFNFFTVMAIVWSIVAIMAGMYAITQGVGSGTEAGDADWHYVTASFLAPGLISCIFAFCKNMDDFIKVKSLFKKEDSE